MNIVGLVGDIHAFLAGQDVAHAFGGALALAYYAEPRGTVDVDLNVFVAFSSAGDVVDAMASLGLYPETPPSEWLPVAGVRLTRRSDGIRVDLFFSIDEEAYAEIRDRMNWFPFGAFERVPFLSAEDLVVFKMSFNRDKDWVDIRHLVKHTPDLDVEYVQRKLVSLRGPTMYPRLTVLRRIVIQVKGR